MTNAIRTSGTTALAFVLCAASAGCAGFERQTFALDGFERQYITYVPNAYSGNEAVPLLVFLHGGGGNGARMIRTFDFERIADAAGFVIVYPEALDGVWNDGRTGPGAEPRRARLTDDVAYLDEVIARVRATCTIDPDRIYLSGPSNGAMMSLRYGCERPDVVSGVAPIIGQLPAALADACPSGVPQALFLITGTDDPLVPFEGGQVVTFGVERGAVLSSDETAAKWAAANGCNPDPERVSLPDTDVRDGTTIERVVYRGCPEAAPVVQDNVIGGGHTWPGGPQYRNAAMIGATNNDYSTEEQIWAFFAGLGSGSANESSP